MQYRWRIFIEVMPPGGDVLDEREIECIIYAETSKQAVMKALEQTEIADDERIHQIHAGRPRPTSGDPD